MSIAKHCDTRFWKGLVTEFGNVPVNRLLRNGKKGEIVFPEFSNNFNILGPNGLKISGSLMPTFLLLLRLESRTKWS